MKSKSTRILRFIIIVYAALYLAAIVSSFYNSELSFEDMKDILFLLLFVMLLAGIGLLWIREKTAAILFMVWNIGIWISDLYLGSGEDRGMLSVMAVPVMVIGALLLLECYKYSETIQPPVPQQWKYILRVLLINYAVLYIIVVISDFFPAKPPDYFNLPFLLFPLMLLVFFVGFALSWKRQFLAGIIFIVWYAILLIGSVVWVELGDSGPWILFGIPVFLQGLFYIKNYLWYKTRQN